MKWLLLFVSSLAWAQTEVEVPNINVYGTPKASSLDSVPTVSELSGARLQKSKASTLGETLSREAGVTSTFFGPNSSRPVIRGQEGDRIRLLENGTGILDASSASQDHAVAVEPLVVEKVEVVRGPATLLYGNNAVGGVVNVTTRRILEKVPDKVTGKAEGRFSSNDLGRNGALSIDSGLGSKWAIHADGSARGSDDYSGGKNHRVKNSFNRTHQEALGLSYVGSRGFIGGSVAHTESSYGTVAEEFVHINMLRTKSDFEGEYRDWAGFKSVRGRVSTTNYKHDEIEDGSLGTTFKNQGGETRLEMRHNPILGFSGLIGWQYNGSDFRAEGDESFLPRTFSRNQSVFIYEEKSEGRFRPSFGFRLEDASVEVEDNPNFGPAEQKSFNNTSTALGFLQQIGRDYAFVVNGSITERAPNYQELFANGEHVATGMIEVGDRNLMRERSRAVEMSLRHKGALGSGSIGAFIQDYENYIMLAPTGNNGPAPENLPIYNYSSVDARFVGAELDYRHNLSHLVQKGVLEMDLKIDWLKGTERKSGNNLPRVTPLRETIAVIYRTDNYQMDFEVQRSERQRQRAPNETLTTEYTFVNLGLERTFGGESFRTTAFARVNNVFDAEGRNHVSMIKDVAPLPGRNFVAGLRASF